ncbi:MAG TPA: hypothetical protein VGF18_05965, partial [Candidatus Tumulicola sp.]
MATPGLSPPDAAAIAQPSHSWMAVDAKNKPNLLYVTNSNNVAVYEYRKNGDVTQVGTLTGFITPKGLCVDKAGDV